MRTIWFVRISSSNQSEFSSLLVAGAHCKHLFVSQGQDHPISSFLLLTCHLSDRRILSRFYFWIFDWTPNSPVIYCCITNPLKSQWLKITTILFSPSFCGSVIWDGLSSRPSGLGSERLAILGQAHISGASAGVPGTTGAFFQVAAHLIAGQPELVLTVVNVFLSARAEAVGPLAAGAQDLYNVTSAIFYW